MRKTLFTPNTAWVNMLRDKRLHTQAIELLSSLRLCANVPGQWAVQTAIGGYQSIKDLVRPGGRLHASRAAIIAGVARSKYLQLTPAPQGAMYSFIGVRPDVVPNFDDQSFAMDLLENRHVLVAPGSSFNVPYRNHFRITHLPLPDMLDEVFRRIEEQLDSHVQASQGAVGGGTRRPRHSRRCADAKVHLNAIAACGVGQSERR